MRACMRRGQVASFLTPSRLAPERIQKAVNGRVAPEIVVVEAREAREGFDARFSATAREYRYAIDTAAVADPFTARLRLAPAGGAVASVRCAPRPATWWGSTTSRRSAAIPARGSRRFATSSGSRSPARAPLVTLRFRANAFLHQMVRTVVGTLVRVGEGKLEPQDVRTMLEARKRSVLSQPAPARGLTLERVLLRDASGDRRPVVMRASFDGVAFPQVALPIGRDARPISHV